MSRKREFQDCEKIRKDFISIQKNQLIHCIWENKCFSIILGYIFLRFVNNLFGFHGGLGG